MALALLLLYASLRKKSKDADILFKLAELVENEEERVRLMDPECPPYAWLLGLTYYDIRHERWRSLAKEVLLNSDASYTPKTREKLQAIGRRLVEIA